MGYHITIITGFTVFCLMACNKHDYCPEPPPRKDNCDLSESSVEYQTATPYTRLQYNKEYDASGRAIKVVASAFDNGLKFRSAFHLKYGSNVVYFMDANETDTVLVALFEDNNRLTKIKQGNVQHVWFFPVEFTYGASRLAHIKVQHEFTFPVTTDYYTKYDANGNITELADTIDGGYNVYYSYNLNVTSTAQFYADDFIFYQFNTFYLAQAMGWLPDLVPVNERIYTSGGVGDDKLKNHVYDSEGRLLSYEGGQTSEGVPLKFINTWTCGLKTKMPN